MNQDPMNQDFGAPEKPVRQGMSRTTKIVLGVVGVLLLLCCGITIVGGFIVTRSATQLAETADDPEAARQAATEIVDYTLPSGFQEEGVMSFGFLGFDIDTVFMFNDSTDGVIVLMAFPAMLAGNEEQMQEQMNDQLNESFGGANVTMSYVESRDVIINDKNVTVNIFEGNDDSGIPFRQATAIFESDSGRPSMVMVMSPQSQWDSSDLDGFIDSLN